MNELTPSVPKVCLVAPLPPPYGGIARWTELITGEATRSKQVRIHVIDTAPRWRAPQDLRIWRRALFGTWHGAQMLGAVAMQMIRGTDTLHITTSASLAIHRDIAMMRLARLFRVPVIYHLRFGRVPSLARAKTKEWHLLAKAMRLASVVIPIDRETEETLRTAMPDLPLHSIPNCVDPETLPTIEPRASTAMKTLLFVGWVQPTKGIEELLTAWEQLDIPGWRLAILGPVAESYLSELQTRHQMKGVEFLGEHHHGEAMEWTARADAFILPSHTEGFPNVVVEAMALGRPIVATTVGAIPEMLDDGECGVLIPPKDPRAIEEKLRLIMQDEMLRNRLGTAARKKFESHYTLAAVFARLVALWQAPKQDHPLTIALLGPLPPPRGGVARWTELILAEATRRKQLRIHLINTALRLREINDPRIGRRLLFGILEAIVQLGRTIVILLVGNPRVMHLTTAGEIGVHRDIVMMYVARLFRVPVLYHLHFGRLPEMASENASEWRRMVKALGLASLVIPIDQKSEEILREKLPELRIHRLHNCVDPKSLPAVVPSHSADSKIVIFVGFVLKNKGIDELLEAWDILGIPGWRLVILGHLTDDYRRELQSNRRMEAVEFLGEIPHSEAMEWMARAEIFVLPSYTEGFPNVVIEAMALGRPILASTVGAIPEMLDGGKCGLLIPPRNTEAIQQGLLSLMQNEALRKQMGEAAQLRFTANYTLQAVFDELEQLWRATQ